MRRFITIRSNGQALTGLPLNSSVKQTKQPVTHLYLLGYNQAWLKSGRRLPVPLGCCIARPDCNGSYRHPDQTALPWQLRRYPPCGRWRLRAADPLRSRLSDLSDKARRCGRHFNCRRRQELPRHGYSSRQRPCSKPLGESNDQNHYDNLGPIHTPCHG